MCLQCPITHKRDGDCSRLLMSYRQSYTNRSYLIHTIRVFLVYHPIVNRLGTHLRHAEFGSAKSITPVLRTHIFYKPIKHKFAIPSAIYVRPGFVKCVNCARMFNNIAQTSMIQRPRRRVGRPSRRDDYAHKSFT